MPDAVDRDDTRRSVLGRAFEILDCLAGGHEMTVTGICADTGLPPATVHRMLAALVEWEGVERVARGRYRLGPRIWRLGIGAPQLRRLRELAQPYLVDLHVMTRGTVYLGMRDGANAVFADRITRVKPTPGSSRATRRMPLQGTGCGRVLLAYSEDAWDQLCEEAAQSETLAAALPGLRDHLAQIRRQGIGIFRNDGLPGRTSVAAPVFGEDGGIVASVAVSFPDTRIPEPRTIAPRVLDTARFISADLARQSGSAVFPSVTATLR
ncbi:IclR family transcriptional regulator [Micromonospora eburnea]|uniref:Transcriptional regulator, IclR family n=1 Tax=Micromonospora eburnea TaxID=227316 RepID=A0A1C6U9H7_9ACTN|nr:IclR family transcriptional regulator [Micromonospora eburnea]SCL50509.1 transcriptional regulator, IclR family [Micromonospora eburnea]